MGTTHTLHPVSRNLTRKYQYMKQLMPPYSSSETVNFVSQNAHELVNQWHLFQGLQAILSDINLPCLYGLDIIERSLILLNGKSHISVKFVLWKYTMWKLFSSSISHPNKLQKYPSKQRPRILFLWWPSKKRQFERLWKVPF